MNNNIAITLITITTLLFAGCGMGKIKKGPVLLDAGNATIIPARHGNEAENRNAEIEFIKALTGEEGIPGVHLSIASETEFPEVLIEILRPALFLSIAFPYEEHEEPGTIHIITGRDKKSRKAAQKLLEALRNYEIFHTHHEIRPGIAHLEQAPGVAITLQIGNFTNSDQAQMLKDPNQMGGLIAILREFIALYAEAP
jgi:hypothetical protein